MTTHVLWVLIHCLAMVVFVNRYLAGVVLRIVRGNKWDETRDDYEPTITVVVKLPDAALQHLAHDHVVWLTTVTAIVRVSRLYETSAIWEYA